MSKLSRIMCFFLAISLLVCLCVSCGTPDSGDPDDSRTASSDTAVSDGTAAEESANATDSGASLDTDAEGYIKDSLPDNIKLGKEKITILYWSDVENPEYFSDEDQSTGVSSALFNRNAKVEQRTGVTFDFVPTPGNSSESKNFLSFVKNAVSGGDKYDIISAHSRSIGLCAYNGLTQDLRTLQYLDFNKPWWQESLLTTATINNQLHFVSGDISTNMLYMMYVVFFNRDVISEHQIKVDPYALAEKGDWTIEKMIEMSKGLYEDLDGIAGKSEGDKFGQAAKSLHTDAFLWGSDILGFKNENSSLILDERFTGEKCTNLIDTLYKYFCESDDAILFSDGSQYKTIFAEGRSLFITDRADIAINDLNDKVFEMGILPIPKNTADQQKYRTIIGNPFSLYAVPTNAEDPDASACVLECLASESYRQVTPVIFEITMKARYSSGSKDALMYDYARDGAVYDLSRVFWKVITNKGTAPDTLFENQLFEGASGWESTIQANQKMLRKIIDDINDAFPSKK